MKCLILFSGKNEKDNVEDGRKSHNHRTQPTNDNKRKSKQTITDSTQATDHRKAKQPCSFL